MAGDVEKKIETAVREKVEVIECGGEKGKRGGRWWEKRMLWKKDSKLKRRKKTEWGSSNNIYKHLSIDPKLNLFFQSTAS